VVRLLTNLCSSSGKSTFTRVIKSTLGITSQRELSLFTDVLRANALQSMQTLLKCDEVIEAGVSDSHNGKVVCSKLHVVPTKKQVSEATSLTPEVAVAVSKLSENEHVEYCFEQRTYLKLHLPDSCYYCTSLVMPFFTLSRFQQLREVCSARF
jgi:hypothetical protein